jgi:hypothetical protein
MQRPFVGWGAGCSGDMHVVAASNQHSPLHNLASWFHQDFNLMGIEPEEWGKEFIKSLSAEERRVLRVELQELQAAYPGKNGKGLRNAWIRLGAESWPRSANLREMIGVWVKALE